ncbi:helix-turn-helix domain-containing protein [Streptomyces tricolor]
MGGSVGGPVAPPRLMDTRDMELASSGYLAQDTFIRQMKRYRKMRGISPEEVVSRIADLGGDLSVQDLTRLEDGTRLLAMAEAQFLAAALDTSVEWLLGSAFQSDAPEELTAPPTDEELQVEAKAVERRIFEIGTQLNHAVMQRAQAVKRAEMARREADMAILLQQQVFTQKAELERQYHYLLGRIDSLRAAKGEEQMLQTHLAEEDEADETPGKLLQHARRRNLMTYEEIESLTRIRPEVIKEIERNNFAALGAGSEHQDAYVRECIRALANAYGIPSEPLIEDYDEFYANKQLPAHLREWRDLEERTGRKHRPRLRGRGFVTEEREGSVPPEKQ